MRDYYEILGVSRKASDFDIKRAYRRLAHVYHPDKNPGDDQAEEHFKKATVAYNVLRDKKKRLHYDRFGSNAWTNNGVSDFREAAKNVSDVFSSIFGDFFRDRDKPSNRARSERGTNQRVDLTIDLETAVCGGEQVVAFPCNERCPSCTGTGAQPGSAPEACYACRGTGTIKVQRGLFSVSKQCGCCGGKGWIVHKRCERCDGRGRSVRDAKLTVKIPPGTRDGETLRHTGRTTSGVNGDDPRRLDIVVNVRDHPLYQRRGNDIHITMPITVFDAILGGYAKVPTLWGTVSMRIPPAIQQGSTLRLKGMGVRGQSRVDRGDQYVAVCIELPTRLNAKQIKLLESAQRQSGSYQFPRYSEFCSGAGQAAASKRRA